MPMKPVRVSNNGNVPEKAGPTGPAYVVPPEGGNDSLIGHPISALLAVGHRGGVVSVERHAAQRRDAPAPFAMRARGPAPFYCSVTRTSAMLLKVPLTLLCEFTIRLYTPGARPSAVRSTVSS